MFRTLYGTSPFMYTCERFNLRMFPLMLGLVGVIFLVYGDFTGAVISLLLGGALTVSYQGVHIDPENQRYMQYDRFLWVRIGRWTAMPRPCYVTIVRINLSGVRQIPSPLVPPEDKKRARSYKVNLVVDGDIRYIPICRGDLDKMTAEALRLGRHLAVRVLDYSTHEKRWIS